MSRVGAPARPVRVTTPRTEDSAAAPKAAPASKPAGFASVSSFAAVRSAGAPGYSGPFGLAPSGVRKLSPNDLGVVPQDQGNTNACGTTSLANVMTHWGVPRTHEQIDKSIRAFDMFTAPDKLVEYARDNGMRAQLKADASLDDIARMVDQGVPPIVLIDPSEGDDFILHYVTVTGYNRDANGEISDLVIADSAGGERYTISAEEFQKKWDNLKLKNVGTGLNNVMISVVPDDGRTITGGDGVARRASEIELPRSSLWGNLKSGFARRVANLLSNATSFAEKAWNTAKAVGNAVGDAAKAVGNAVGDAAKAVGNGVKKVWKSIFG